MSVCSEYQCVMIHMSVITQSGQSALMKGISYGHTDTVKELVTAGANLNLQNNVCQYSNNVQTLDIHEPHCGVCKY